MNKNDALGNRMKTYENVTRNYLTRRTPVIIRIDGKAFHTFTRGFKKPFDNNIQKMVSVSASMATMAFNNFFSHNVEDLESDLAQEHETDGMTEWVKNYALVLSGI